MKIKHAKLPNLIYGLLALLMLAVPYIMQNPEFEKAPALKISYLVLFGLTGVYFFYRALNNKPLYIISKEEITDCKNHTTYKLSELGYYKTQTVRFKFSTLVYVNFYDTKKIFVFKVQVNGTNCSTQQLINIVKPKLQAYE